MVKPDKDQELEHILRAAQEDIRELRKTNRELSLVVDTFNRSCDLFYGSISPKSQGFSEDVVWRIDRFLEQKAEADAR